MIRKAAEGIFILISEKSIDIHYRVELQLIHYMVFAK